MRIAAGAVGPGVHPERNETGNVRIGLRNGGTGLEAGDALIRKAGELFVLRIEGDGDEDVEVLIDETEAARHNADDFACLRIDHNTAADDRAVAPETALPVAIAEDD